MTFLEAHKIIAQFEGGPPLAFLFAISGTADKLDVFLRAAGATKGRSVAVRTLPFNTLAQTLLREGAPGEPEVFVLFPWDLVPEADWRSGLPSSPLDVAALKARARETLAQLARRTQARILYVPAPIPPLFSSPAITSRLAAWLTASIADAAGDVLSARVFSLASYLSTGCPFASSELGSVAEAVVEHALGVATDPKKVLVTDLDNVMWRGVIGEDGMDGISYLAEGAGFRHFLYQTFLSKLKREGVLLAAVSRNDIELAAAPFRSGQMALGVHDFLVIVASYNAKSSQIKAIARQLNLGLDSFVFVDDNPIEIEEVSSAIPAIRSVLFPQNDEAVPRFFDEVAALFARVVLTREDHERTELYRRRLEGMVPASGEGADLTTFLRGLEMSLSVNDRSWGDRVRAVQLINKTNQFNLNGRRVSDEEVGEILAKGGRLYTCTLNDRTGSHGEILACLIDGAGTIRSLVMSCRVFQRRVEHAFLTWLASREHAPHALEFVSTSHNEPIRQFLDDPAFTTSDQGPTLMDGARFAHVHSPVLELFRMSTLGDARI